MLEFVDAELAVDTLSSVRGETAFSFGRPLLLEGVSRSATLDGYCRTG